MNELIDILKTDSSYNTLLIVCLSGLCYLWKHYDKIIRTFIKQSDKNFNLLNEIKEIVKNSNLIESSISDSIEDLNRKIDDLERRLGDLERILVETKTTDKEILKDIETVRKSMEILQIVRTLSKK